MLLLAAFGSPVPSVDVGYVVLCLASFCCCCTCCFLLKSPSGPSNIRSWYLNIHSRWRRCRRILITHISAARTKMIARTMPAMRPDETLDFEGGEVAAGEEDDDGVDELVANELVDEALGVLVETELIALLREGEDVGDGELTVVEVAAVVTESPA